MFRIRGTLLDALATEEPEVEKQGTLHVVLGLHKFHVEHRNMVEVAERLR